MACANMARGVLRAASPYRTVSESVMTVIAGLIPVTILVTSARKKTQGRWLLVQSGNIHLMNGNSFRKTIQQADGLDC